MASLASPSPARNAALRRRRLGRRRRRDRAAARSAAAIAAAGFLAAARHRRRRADRVRAGSLPSPGTRRDRSTGTSRARVAAASDRRARGHRPRRAAGLRQRRATRRCSTASRRRPACRSTTPATTALADAGRAAWRDGIGAGSTASHARGAPIAAQIARAGDDDDMLVWRFADVAGARSRRQTSQALIAGRPATGSAAAGSWPR